MKKSNRGRLIHTLTSKTLALLILLMHILLLYHVYGVASASVEVSGEEGVGVDEIMGSCTG